MERRWPPVSDPSYPANTAEETAPTPAHGSGAAYPGTPHWVKVGAMVAVIVVLLVMVTMVLAGGEHGPMRHIPSGSGEGTTPLITAVLHADWS